MSEEDSARPAPDVSSTADEWFDAFAKSPAFTRLNDSQQRKAGAIIDYFARYTADHLGLSPAKWDRGAVWECCVEALPRKVSAEASYFEAVAPVLSAYFAFLEDQSLLSHGHALAELVEALHDDIVAAAEDRSNWGPAKHFVMAAQDAGVNIQDPSALQAFMLEYNLRQAARMSRPAASAPFPTAERSPPSVGPYDPCPCGSGRKYKFCCKERG